MPESEPRFGDMWIYDNWLLSFVKRGDATATWWTFLAYREQKGGPWRPALISDAPRVLASFGYDTAMWKKVEA